MHCPVSQAACNVVNQAEVPLSWFGNTLWQYTPIYVELVFLAICLRLIGIVEPFLFQIIIDRVLPFQREATLVIVTVLFALASVFRVSFSVLSTILGVAAANRVTRELGGRIFEHLFKLPFSHFRQWTVGETISRVGETDTIRAFIIGACTGTVIDGLFVVIYIGVLYALSPTLTGIVLIALPLQGLIYLGFGPFLRNRLKTQFDDRANHQTQMVESLSGASTVKALGLENEVVGRLDATLFATLQSNLRVRMLQLTNGQLIYVADRIVTVSVIFIGAQLVFSAQLTLGQLIAFLLLSSGVAAPISNFASLWESWQNVRVSRQRLADILCTEQEPFNHLPALPDHPARELVLSDISFSYNDDILLLSGLSVSAQAGLLTLIVGPSGIGKSTFGRLASGIEKPTGGQVLLNGFDISQFDPASVRKEIAYVPQDPFLFQGSIEQNLKAAAPHASESDIFAALNFAAANDVVANLPQGIQTQVGERGLALSGGQRQRVAIARSMLLEPKVLILDEPTNALDEVSQRLIVTNIERLAETMLIIVITHRVELFTSGAQIVDFGKLA
jgi:subfamily B ATP-binding cassette protein HlyB/CyaB